LVHTLFLTPMLALRRHGNLFFPWALTLYCTSSRPRRMSGVSFPLYFPSCPPPMFTDVLFRLFPNFVISPTSPSFRDFGNFPTFSVVVFVHPGAVRFEFTPPTSSTDQTLICAPSGKVTDPALRLHLSVCTPIFPPVCRHRAPVIALFSLFPLPPAVCVIQPKSPPRSLYHYGVELRFLLQFFFLIVLLLPSGPFQSSSCFLAISVFL